MAEVHGINGLIYVSGTEITGANSWSLNINKDTVQTIKFGDAWKTTLDGAKDWSGQINAYEEGDSKVLVDSALASGGVTVTIYPDKNDTGDYYTGTGIFGGASSDGNTTSAVNKNGSFMGTGALTVTGFA